jgi:hypothetical protein
MPNPFGPYYSLQFVFLLVCAILYYKIADLEDESSVLWMGLSIATFMLTWRLLGWGYLGNFFGQALLFGGITLLRVWRDRRGNSE